MRKIIFEKYNGLCAYTGKKLDDTWQVDHIKSKSSYEQIVTEEAHFLTSAGNKLTCSEHQKEYKRVSERLKVLGYRDDEYFLISRAKYIPPKTKPHPSCNHINNLIPCFGIINHYKRGFDLEGFRLFMVGFRTRWLSIKRDTKNEKQHKRLEYLDKIANLFDITEDNDFDGQFYFEKLNDKNNEHE